MGWSWPGSLSDEQEPGMPGRNKLSSLRLSVCLVSVARAVQGARPGGPYALGSCRQNAEHQCGH